MKRLIGLLSIYAFSNYAAVVVQGNDTVAPFAFKTEIISQTYDYTTGMFFVGLTAGVSGVNNGTYTISKANRPSFTSIPKFSPVILTDDDPLTLSNASVKLLSLSAQSSNPILTGVKLTSKKVFALYTDGKSQVETDELNDAGGNDTDDIVNIVANSDYIFAAVAPQTNFWGETDSGIALIGIASDGSTITLSEKIAAAGTDGNLAALLDKSSVELRGSNPADVMITNTTAAMYWDELMERLFIGFSVSSDSSMVKSIVVARLNMGALLFEPITPNDAIVGGIGEIAVDTGSNISFLVDHVAVMHASTGPDYLIIDDRAPRGSIGGRRIFAAPLVNDINNPTASTNGTFAKYNSALDSTTHKFTTPASNMGDLLFNNAQTRPEAVVGAGDLPLQELDYITGLKVVDDAVYVSISDNDGAPLDESDRGIFVSHAMFDDTGRIIRWTPWTKRVIPFNAFPGISLPGGATHNGAISFFEVDGKTASVWLVEHTTGKTVGITAWSTGQETNGLLQTVSSALKNGVYAILDLDQATRGFLSSTPQRYALFGGVNQVVFARVSESFNQALAASDQSYNASPQSVITDFSLDENFKIVDLPDPGGCCTVLEYSRTSTTVEPTPVHANSNFFFAGTEKGLYVFSVDNNAFSATELSTLNLTPFDDGAWQKIDTITGSIIDIKTSGAGETLYIITSESTATEPMKSTLYSVPFANTVGSMFASSNIRTIAQTGVGTLKKVLQFYGIQIIATGDARLSTAIDKEQLILATNQGLFISAAEQTINDGVSDALNQTNANWELFEDSSQNLTTATTMFNGIAGPNTPIRQTAWPFQLKDKSGFGIFDNGAINQVSGIGDPAMFNAFFTPLQFNADSSDAAFKSLDRIINFFSDGGRRLFVFNRTQDPPTQTKIGVLPYNVSLWNIVQPGIVSNPTLDTFSRFYWTSMIGDTGLLGAGTERGLVGLE